jgi:hypothetical protein
MTAPPITFPIVTGSRLRTRNASTVRFEESAGARPIAAQNSAGAYALMAIASGMKYMFATLCWNPMATNAAIGARSRGSGQWSYGR